jgi:RNA polymerase sigma-70 factor (ECF subfamily)
MPVTGDIALLAHEPRGASEAELATARQASLLRCVEGDAASWRQLHRRYHPLAVAFLRKLGVLERDLDDACQEVFLQMFRYLPSFRGEAEPKTWLYRLCITQARRTRTRLRLRKALDLLLARTPEAAPVASPAFCEQAARRRMEAALAQLSESDRTVFVLFEMEGLPGDQVASIVGCKEATLWRRLHYARERFRQALLGTEEAA